MFTGMNGYKSSSHRCFYYSLNWVDGFWVVTVFKEKNEEVFITLT